MKIWVKGEPATFLTRREKEWRVRIREGIGNFNVPSNHGIVLRFIVSSWRRRGHYFDVDNLAKPILDELGRPKCTFVESGASSRAISRGRDCSRPSTINGKLSDLYADRAVLIPATDQGPLLVAGIPSIELTTEGDHPVLQDEIYHAPGDLMPLMRVESFRAFGRIAERMVRTLDAITIPREEQGVRLPDGRVASGWLLRLVQIGLFLPLLVATVLTTRQEP